MHDILLILCVLVNIAWQVVNHIVKACDFSEVKVSNIASLWYLNNKFDLVNFAVKMILSS